MARILQDGFETEGKEISNNYAEGRKTVDLDVADLIFEMERNVNFQQYKFGLCQPRGGYGTKGFRVVCNNKYDYYTTYALKYDLTKCCNDTSELFYRVWFKPSLTSSLNNVNYTTMTPIVITDINAESEVNKISTNLSNFTKLSHCVLKAVLLTSNTYSLKCYCKGALVYDYNYLNYDEWVKIDVRLKVGDANNGIFQLRINDKLITTFNGLTGTTNPKYLYVGNAVSNTYLYCSYDVDDIAVNDTTGNVNNSWCGNGSIVGIVPSANGSKTMFTPGVEGTQNYENVDELVPDGDVTYNSSYALNDIDTFKFTIPENFEIPPTETINAISVITTAKFVEQPTDIGHIVSDGATETLIGQHTLSNGYTPHTSIIQEKSDGTKFKVSDIDNLEFGYKTLESTQAQEE